MKNTKTFSLCCALWACVGQVTTSEPNRGDAASMACVTDIECDDGDPCTDDACDPSSGCVYTNNTSLCDDDDACTDNDTCSDGACAGAPIDVATVCDDGRACSVDHCAAATGCYSDTSECCTTSADCDDENVCTDDSCNHTTGICENTPNTINCSDGNACTVGDVCSNGSCTPGATLECDDGNICTDDSCDPASGCVAVNNTAACNDADACTEDDICGGATCAGTPVDVATFCDDGVSCTVDSCNSATGCMNDTAACPCEADGDCADSNPCTDDSCNLTNNTCDNTPNSVDCDDDNACTTGDSCSGGTCVPGAAIDCDDGNFCTTNGCNPSSGCTVTNNTNNCDDDDACTTSDTCNSGECVGGPALNCNDDNDCTDDSCNPTSGCANDNNTDPCSDDDKCTTGDTCGGGSCNGTPVDVATFCDDSLPCSVDSCDSALGCQNDTATCSCSIDSDCTPPETFGGGGIPGMCGVALDPLDTLASRLFDHYLTTTDTTEVATHLANQNADGSWSDLPYDAPPGPLWPPTEHFHRLRRMAAAYNNPEHALHLDTGLRAAILLGVDYWPTASTTPNQWYRTMGVPLAMGPVLILMKPHLSSGQLSWGIWYMGYGIQDNVEHYWFWGNPTTGANRMWIAQVDAMIAVLQHSHDRAAKAFWEMGGILVTTTDEGIQPDFSFHQHGPQLYNGGYGRTMAADLALWAHHGHALPAYQYESSAIATLSGLLLDGSQWMIRRGYWDPLAKGRAVSRPGHGKMLEWFVDALARMKETDTARAGEYQDFLDHIHGTYDAALVGNKHFWNSDYQAHRRADYSIHLKMASNRTYHTEEVNGDNLQGYHLASGITTILVEGSQYFDIFPLWHWSRLPGVTAADKQPAPKPATLGEFGLTGFVGGASNGTYGVAVYNQNRDGVVAQKSYFFFDDEFVALGSGIGRSVDSLPVRTTLNSTFKVGDAYVSYDSESSHLIEETSWQSLANPEWVYHNQIGYLFLENSSAAVINQTGVSSNWSVVSSNRDQPVTGDRFTLLVDHGAYPSGATYQYAVLPGKTLAEMQAYATAPQVRVISNVANTVQAVRNDTIGVAGLVFYQAGGVEVRPGLTVTVDHRCAVIVDESTATTKVTVANPGAFAATINLTLIYASDSVALEFPLPGGAVDGGKSFTQTIP